MRGRPALLVRALGILPLLIMSAATTAAPARAAAPAVLGQLLGTWAGSGTVNGANTQLELRWERALDGRYVRLDHDSRMSWPDGRTFRFTAIAFYRGLDSSRCEATWFDNTANTRPITASATATTLLSDWGTPATEVGRTHYRLLPDNSLSVLDSVRTRQGTWREFGRATLRRTP